MLTVFGLKLSCVAISVLVCPPAIASGISRSPRRPNPIGLSIVRLMRVEGATLHIEEVDLVDGTPVLDIKPYVPQLDDRATDRMGWFAANVHKVYEVRADDRNRRDTYRDSGGRL